MSKRRAEKQLTDANWQEREEDDDNSSQGEGVFKRAADVDLSKRKIRGLPSSRKGVTGAGKSLISPSLSPASTPLISSAFTPVDVNLQYYMTLRGLNVSLLSHFQQCIEKDPFIDLSVVLPNVLSIYSKERKEAEAKKTATTMKSLVPPEESTTDSKVVSTPEMKDLESKDVGGSKGSLFAGFGSATATTAAIPILTGNVSEKKSLFGNFAPAPATTLPTFTSTASEKKSLFGNIATAPPSDSPAGEKKEEKKSLFGGFGETTAAPIFGAEKKEEKKSLFGGFGGATPASTSSTDEKKEEKKSLFGGFAGATPMPLFGATPKEDPKATESEKPKTTFGSFSGFSTSGFSTTKKDEDKPAAPLTMPSVPSAFKFGGTIFTPSPDAPAASAAGGFTPKPTEGSSPTSIFKFPTAKSNFGGTKSTAPERPSPLRVSESAEDVTEKDPLSLTSSTQLDIKKTPFTFGSKATFGETPKTPPKPTGFGVINGPKASPTVPNVGFSFGGTSSFSFAPAPPPPSFTSSKAPSTIGADTPKEEDAQNPAAEKYENPFTNGPKAGEENEDIVGTERRAKLYKHTPEGKLSWTEVGVGNVSIKKHKEDRKRRLLGRTDAGNRVMLNVALNKTFKIILEGNTVFFQVPENGALANRRMRLRSHEEAKALQEDVNAEIKAFEEGN